MKVCGICGKPHSLFLMNNKRVCLACDELLFDIEIEIDPEELLLNPTEKVRTLVPSRNKTTAPSDA